MTQKTKRMLLITIPAAVLIAAALLLWLFLGRETQTEQPFEIRRDQESNQVVYCGVKGETAATPYDAGLFEEAELLPCYAFSPPEGWEMKEDGLSAGYLNYYADLYENQDGATLQFIQAPAVAQTVFYSDGQSQDEGVGKTVLQEVQFGDQQMIYMQTGEISQLYWVYRQSLLNFTCTGEADLSQLLEWVSLVDYNTLREEPQSAPVPLTLQRGSYQEIIQGTTVQVEEHPYESQGSPEIPQPPVLPDFSAPAGYTVEKQWEDPDGYACEWLYVGEEGTRLYFSCVAGEAGFFGSRGYGNLTLPFSGMSREELADPNAVSDTVVKGNPAFVHINDQVSEIGWIDGYCTLQIRSTAPMTEEELIALAETVE